MNRIHEQSRGLKLKLVFHLLTGDNLSNLHLEDAKVASVVSLPQNCIAIVVNVLQMDPLVSFQVDQTTRVAGVHLMWHVGGHRVQALQEWSVSLKDDKSVLVVRVVVAYLGVYVI